MGDETVVMSPDEKEFLKTSVKILISSFSCGIVYLCVSITFRFLEGERMDIFRELLVSILCSVVISTVSHIVAYFLFLKKLPDKIHKEVESVLRQETERNTSFQMNVGNAIVPTNYELSKQHETLYKEIADVCKEIQNVADKFHPDSANLTDSIKQITRSVENLTGFAVAFKELYDEKESIQERCYDLEEEAVALRQELNDLRSSQSTSEAYPQQIYMNNPKTR